MTMGLSLSQAIVQRAPRETSGSRSANRFDFQKDWVVCLILDLHSKKTEYLVICDYHEDVILLDRESNPGTAAYFQIKTHTGSNWTVKTLVSRSKGKNKRPLPSILGKLYSNYLLAPALTESLNFVSNAYYNFKLRNGKDSRSLTSIACSELFDSEVQEIVTCLTSELTQACSLPGQPYLLFSVSSLSLQEHSTHATGKLAEFLNSYLPGKSHHVVSIYKILFDEVRRKTTREGQFSDFDELRICKGIGRSAVEDLLKRAAATVDLQKTWEEARERLVKEELPAMRVRDIGEAWQKYEVHRMDPANDFLQRLRERVRSLVLEIITNNPDVSLTELASEVWQNVREAGIVGTYSFEYVQAMAIMEAYVSEEL